MSLALVVTAVYGDLLKRVLPGTVALMSLYAVAAVILFVMLAKGRRNKRSRMPVVSRLAGLLMVTYYGAFCTSFDADLLSAMMMLTYICVPLGFIVVIPRSYPDFDICAMALYTTILMVPMHAVGAVQEFVDEQFMVSTAYSEVGGVIARNFLEGTDTFNRLPSLFASADRYANVSAMQVFLTLLLLSDHLAQKRWALLWSAFSLLMAAAGLMFAGARSRILIVGAALLVAGLALLVGSIKGRLSPHGRAIMMRSSLIMGFLLATALASESVRDRISDLPIFSLLEQTAERGDIENRFQQGVDVSAMPDDVKFFGEGLGTSAGGRPGEFGIRAMWIEGGLFWTLIMLMVHSGILMGLTGHTLLAVSGGNVVLSLIFAASCMLWFNGVLAGLSATFELSTTLLFFPLMAVALMESRARPYATTRRRVH